MSPESESASRAEAAPATATLRGKGGWIVLALALTAVDLWTKHAVFASLAEHDRHWIAGHWFGLTPVMNPGIMWGAFKELVAVLPWLRIVAAVVVLVMMSHTPASARTMLLALALVLGGALGNIYDGLAYGMVRDFLLVDLGVRFFDPFPVFNLADSGICVGVTLLALSLLLDRRAPSA